MGNPLVAILIATKNGSKHLFEQLTSIQNQVDVTPTIYISDDASSDETLKVVDEFGILQSNINNGTHGSAAKNFFQMIINHEVSIDEKFVFLSDQDDIWLPKKCIRAIELMRRNGADAYSGSYFSMNKRKIRYVNKARKINGVDHIFGSPGPGFTFAFQRNSFLAMQNLLRAKREHLEGIRWHDYAIYFIAIENGFKWVIDDEPMALYRLHGANDTGQAIDVKGIIFRLRFLFSGRYRQQLRCLTNFAVLPSTKKTLMFVDNFNLMSRFHLLGVVTASRKTLRDRIMILLWILFSKR